MAGAVSEIAPHVPAHFPATGRARSWWAMAAGDLLQRRAALVGLAIYLVIVFFAITANVVSPYPPNQIKVTDALQLPSTIHLLGTDELGRDILTRVIYGARVSIMVGVISITIALIVGVPLGLIAGFYGHSPDAFISRLGDALLAFPSIVLALAIISVLGPSLQNAMIAIGIVYVPVFIRLVGGGGVCQSERVRSRCACRRCKWRVPDGSYRSAQHHLAFVGAAYSGLPMRSSPRPP